MKCLGFSAYNVRDIFLVIEEILIVKNAFKNM